LPHTCDQGRYTSTSEICGFNAGFGGIAGTTDLYVQNRRDERI
jgi:hypothetical protein